MKRVVNAPKRVCVQLTPRHCQRELLERFCAVAIKSFPMFVAHLKDHDAAEEAHAEWLAQMILKELWKRYDPARGPMVTFVRRYSSVAAKHAAIRRVVEMSRTVNPQRLREVAQRNPRHELSPLDALCEKETLHAVSEATVGLCFSQNRAIRLAVQIGSQSTAALAVGTTAPRFRARVQAARNALGPSAINHCEPVPITRGPCARPQGESVHGYHRCQEAGQARPQARTQGGRQARARRCEAGRRPGQEARG